MKQLLKGDFLIMKRQRGSWLHGMLFFVVTCSLFSITLQGDRQLLSSLGERFIWVACLLTSVLTSDGLFRADFLQGVLAQWMLSVHAPEKLVCARLISYWLVNYMPLLFLAPVFSLSFGLSGHDVLILEASLLLGTPSLASISAIGSALTLGLSRGGMLLCVLLLPLYVTILILGIGHHLLLLAGLLFLSLGLAPWGLVGVLTIALED